jgi:Zn-dependent M28 family amino/carboxypeptidase
LIEGWVDDAAARALFVAAGRDFAAEVAAAAHPGFKAIPLGMKVDAMLHNNVRELSAANVVGLLPGAGRGKEYVAYVAHWDQLGMDTSRTGRNIYSGAVEDASGTAGLLALAQSFVRTTPRVDRSIVFLAVTGGESGLLGANFYCDHPLYPLRVTAAVIDVDGLLDGGHTRDLSIYGYGNSSLDEVAGEEALLQGREAHPDPTPQWGFFYRSDSYAFAMHGVPVLFAQSGIDDAARGPAFGRQQREAYFAERYLRPTDQYSPDWNVVGALDDLTLYYQVGNRLATSRRFPRWNPSSEFRAAKRSSIPDGE